METIGRIAKFETLSKDPTKLCTLAKFGDN